MAIDKNAARCDVEFRGRVQGVGFRRTVADIATSYPITGYVSNRDGGGVHLVAEGTHNDVSLLIQEVQAAMKSAISESTLAWSDRTGEFPDFQIRRNEP